MKYLKQNLSGLFYVPKHEKVSDISFSRIITSSILGILLCIICLAGLTWAWFSGSATSTANTITAAEFKVNVSINGSEITSEDGTYTLSQEDNRVTVTAVGSATTGYCQILFDGNIYHTSQIFTVSQEGKPQSVTFTVNATAGDELVITPQWGTYAKPDGETLIEANGEIGNVSEAQSQGNDENEPQTTEPVANYKAENNTENSQTEPTTQTSNVSSAEAPKEDTVSQTQSEQ